MRYKIEVIDTVNSDLVAEERISEVNTLHLERSGSDEKQQDLIVTELRFSFIDNTSTDAVFVGLFTANEYQFKVVLTNLETNLIEFSGFLLPETYEEPYHGGPISVVFSATCGLGLLKGRYFDSLFYKDEHSVIEVISACLVPTGLDLSFNFVPAIEHTTEKDFTDVFLDFLHFHDVEKDEFTDIYDVFVQLLRSLGCICFQEDGVWQIIGYNKRFLLKYNAKLYDYLGNYITVSEVVRKRIVANPLVYPLVRIDPKRKKIIVTKEKKDFGFNEGVYKLKDEGYVGEIAVNKNLFANEWLQNNNINGIAKISDLLLRLPIKYNASSTHLNTDYISLYRKLPVEKGTKLRFKLEVEIDSDTSDTGLLEAYVADGTFSDPLLYDLLLNDTSILSNGFGGNQIQQGQLNFDKNKKAKIEYTFICQEDGRIDLRIYQPYRVSFIPFNAFFFNLIKLEQLGPGLDKEVAEIVIDENFSKVEDIDIPIGVDISGNTLSFNLTKYRERTVSYETEFVTVLYAYESEGKNIAVVSLYDAMLIERSLYDVYLSAANITVNEVVYNYDFGEQMVIITEQILSIGDVLSVRVYGFEAAVIGDFNSWTDSVYQVEDNTFVESFAKIINRLYNKETFLIEATFQGKIGFNDLVNFVYNGVKDFYLTSSSYNLSENETTVFLHEGLYDGGTTVLIPPVVNAGTDIYLDNTATTASLTATAFDPDGLLTSVLWVQVLPVPPLAEIISPDQLNTNLTGLIEDLYEFQVTVQDDQSLTASDTLKIIRDKDYTIVITETYSDSETISETREERRYSVTVNPPLVSGIVLNLCVNTFLEVTTSGLDAVADSVLMIKKNGFELYNEVVQDSGLLEEKFSLSFISTDLLEFTIKVVGSLSDPSSEDFYSKSKLEFESVEFVYGVGAFTNLPIYKEIVITD